MLTCISSKLVTSYLVKQLRLNFNWSNHSQQNKDQWDSPSQWVTSPSWRSNQKNRKSSSISPLTLSVEVASSKSSTQEVLKPVRTTSPVSPFKSYTTTSWMWRKILWSSSIVQTPSTQTSFTRRTSRCTQERLLSWPNSCLESKLRKLAPLIKLSLQLMLTICLKKMNLKLTEISLFTSLLLTEVDQWEACQLNLLKKLYKCSLQVYHLDVLSRLSVSGAITLHFRSTTNTVSSHTTRPTRKMQLIKLVVLVLTTEALTWDLLYKMLSIHLLEKIRKNVYSLSLMAMLTKDKEQLILLKKVVRIPPTQSYSVSVSQTTVINSLLKSWLS